MNLTPKKDFLEKKVFADAHRDLVVSTPFREALNAALLQYVLSIPVTQDPATSFHRIEGARDFVHALLNIAEMSKDPPTPPTTNLNHGAK